MIRIGLSHRQKQKEIKDYLDTHKIKKAYCFYYKDFKPSYKTDCEIEYIEYSDIEMYKYFYRLLEEIGEDSLIIIDGCLRTQNRSELIYNCAHHYLNQTPHHIIFEYFPIIDNKNDFMILMDFDNPSKYKGRSFEYNYLKEEDIKIRFRKVKLKLINVEVTAKEKELYEKKKEFLFDNLGNKDPDTIPRNLQLIVGNFKAKAIDENKLYIARNKRLKKKNVITYREASKGEEYIIIDTHYRRLNMNDFLKLTETDTINYLCTNLSIDNVIIDEFSKWKARVEAIYAKANIYK